MVNVDVLFGGWLKAPNGAASVVNSLNLNKEIFVDQGVNIKFWSLDDPFPREFNFNEKENIIKSLKQKVKSIIKSKLGKFSKKNLYFAKKSIKRGMNFSEIVADYYLKHKKKDDSKVLIHDFFTCYYYLKKRKQKQLTYLVLHNNGDTFSMFLEYYPCLMNSSFYQKMLDMEKYVLSNIDQIVFVAENPKKYFLELHPVYDTQKVTFIYNGINDKRIKSRNNNSRLEIVCVGSVSTRKGQDIIVEAIYNLTELEREKIHVTIVGDGDIRSKLEEFSYENNLPISFVGYSKQIDKFLSRSNIFLLPSRDEGFPISILEAERAGLPIISTKVAGIPEMVTSKENGILINPNVQELTELFRNINDYDWEKLGEKSRKMFEEKFTINKMINGYVELLT